MSLLPYCPDSVDKTTLSLAYADIVVANVFPTDDSNSHRIAITIRMGDHVSVVSILLDGGLHELLDPPVLALQVGI